MPRAIIVAGPNGAGKTTFSRSFLPNEANCIQFVNADLIAAGLSPFAPETAAVAAGRASLRRLSELASEYIDFAVETTLSGSWLVKYLLGWQASGYTVELYYLALQSPDLAVERVRQRVAAGGHNIPEEVIRRRYGRSQILLESTYKPIVDFWIMYDNSGHEPRWISEGKRRVTPS